MANNKFNIVGVVNLQLGNTSRFVSSINQQLNSLNSSGINKVNSGLKTYNNNINNATKQTNVFGRNVQEAFSRFTVVAVVTGTLVGLTRSLKNAVSEAIQFEREINKIEQASGKNAFQLKTLSDSISDVSTKYGVASKELSVAARNLIQAGYSASKVSGMLDILAQTELAATFDNINDTAEGMIAILSQFGKTAMKTGNEIQFLERSMSAINEVSKAYAVESADIITAVRTTGAAFESAGGDLNEFIALFTSVRATTRESAESIATGFRTIFTRIQRVDTIEALRNLGIELRDVEGKFVGPMEAVQRLSSALNSIDPRDARFNIVTEQLGGYRQIQKVIPLIQQLGVTQKALDMAQKSNGSTAQDAETAQKSLAVQIQKTREEFSRFVRDLVASDEFKKMAQWGLEFADALIKIGDSLRPLIPLLGPIIAGKLSISLLNTVAQFGGYSVGTKGGKKYAFGGTVVPGSGNTDSVPAMLTPGEFVLTKSAAQKIGYGNLKNLNKIHKFARGGSVGPQANSHVQMFAIQKFEQDMANSIDQDTLKKIKSALTGIANSGHDVEAAMKVFAREIKQHGVAFDYNSSLPRVQNAITKGNYSRYLTQQVSNTYGQNTNQKQNSVNQQKDEEFTSNLKQNALLFGVLATSVISSIDSMKEFGDDVQYAGKMASIAGANFVAFKTIGLAVTNIAKELGSHFPKFRKFGDALDGLTTGFAIAQAIISVQVEQHAEAIRKNTAIIDESISNLNKNRTVEKSVITKSIKESIIEDSNQKTWGSTGNYIARGIGALALGVPMGIGGAALGAMSTFGVATPAGFIAGLGTGAAIGGTAGGNIAYQLGIGENPKLAKEADGIANRLTENLFKTYDSLKLLNKGIEELGNTAKDQIQNKFKIGVDNYIENINNLTNQINSAKSLYGGVEKAPAGVKSIISQQTSNLEDAFNSINVIMGEMNKRFSQELSVKLNDKNFDPNDFANKQISEIGPIIKKITASKVLNETGDAGRAQKEALKAEKDYREQINSMTERSTILHESMLEAQLKEIAIRNKLIGTISSQIAMENAIANITYSIEKTMKSFNAFGDALEMQSSRIINPSILDVKSPSDTNKKDYEKALSSVSKIIPDGDKLAKNFQELQSVSLKLQVALEKNPLSISQSEKDIDSFIQSLGASAGSGVESALKQAILKATKIDEASDAKTQNPSEIGRQVVDSFDKYKDQISKVMKDFLAKNNEVFANEIEIRKAQNAAIQEQFQIQMSGLEKYNELNQNIATALDQEVSLRDKFNIMNKRQVALAGGMAGNPAEISERLKFLRSESEKPIGVEAAQKISVEANNLNTALKELADQSTKTSAVMEELQRLKGLREVFKDFSSNATFGTGEQRYNMAKTFSQAMQLAMTGNINMIPDNDRNAVQSLLKQFKDLPIFNGLTGKQVENMAMVNFLKSIRAFPAAQMIANDTSTPEQKMIGQLKAIYEQEAVSRTKLIELEQEKINKGNISLDANTKAIENLSRDILNVIGIINPQGFASGGPVGKGFKPKGTDTIPAMLSKGEYVLNKKAVDRIGVDNLDKLNTQYFARGGRAGRSLYLQRAKKRQFDLAGQEGSSSKQSLASTAKAYEDIEIQNKKLEQRRMMGQQAILKNKLNEKDESYYIEKRNKATEDLQRRNLYAQNSFAEKPVMTKSGRKMESPELIKARENQALESIDINPLIYESKGMSKLDYVNQKYGNKKPKDMSMETWYKRIAQSRNQKKSDFFRGVTEKGMKSPNSNYAKPADSPYNYELQQSLKKAKELGSRADAHMEKKFGIKPGKNYKSLDDVPVLTGDQVGKAVTPNDLNRMEKQSQSNTPFYFNGSNFSPAQEMANKKASEFKKPYEGSSPYERYLNADSKNKFVDSTRQRYQNNRNVSFPQMVRPSNTAIDIPNRNNKPMLNVPSSRDMGMNSDQLMSIDKLQQFNDQFKETVSMLNGMTMTHKITVDGQLTIGGINVPEVAVAIQNAVGNMIKQEVERVFNSKGRQAQ